MEREGTAKRQKKRKRRQKNRRKEQDKENKIGNIKDLYNEL